jgi:hypothetical protein
MAEPSPQGSTPVGCPVFQRLPLDFTEVAQQPSPVRRRRPKPQKIPGPPPSRDLLSKARSLSSADDSDLSLYQDEPDSPSRSASFRAWAEISRRVLGGDCPCLDQDNALFGLEDSCAKIILKDREARQLKQVVGLLIAAAAPHCCIPGQGCRGVSHSTDRRIQKRFSVRKLMNYWTKRSLQTPVVFRKLRLDRRSGVVHERVDLLKIGAKPET